MVIVSVLLFFMFLLLTLGSINLFLEKAKHRYAENKEFILELEKNLVEWEVEIAQKKQEFQEQKMTEEAIEDAIFKWYDHKATFISYLQVIKLRRKGRKVKFNSYPLAAFIYTHTKIQPPKNTTTHLRWEEDNKTHAEELKKYAIAKKEEYNQFHKNIPKWREEERTLTYFLRSNGTRWNYEIEEKVLKMYEDKINVFLLESNATHYALNKDIKVTRI